MRKPMTLHSLVLAATVAGASLASAQDGPPPPPHHGPPGMQGMPGMGPGPHGMHWRKGHGQDRAMRIARRLAAVETLIGVRSDQLDAWRAFTSAAVDFMAPLPPKPPADGDRQDRLEAFALADRMADKAIARAEKAKALKDAVAALRQKLTPEQLERVRMIQRDMLGRFRGHGGPGPMPKPEGGPPPAPDQKPR